MNLMDENLQKFIRACITCIIAWIALVGCSKDDDFVSTYSERQEKAFALFNGTWADIQFSNLSGGEFCCRLIILATFAIVLHISMAVARTANNPLAVFLYPDGNIYRHCTPVEICNGNPAIDGEVQRERQCRFSIACKHHPISKPIQPFLRTKKRESHFCNSLVFSFCNSLVFSGVTGNRTRDTRIFSPLLYQLSYDTIFSFRDCKDSQHFFVCKFFLCF